MGEEKQFVRLREHCGHEGESWNFYIPFDDNVDAVNKLQEKLEKFELDENLGDISFELDKTLIPESEVDILVKHSDQGYMDFENKLEGILTVPDWKDYESVIDDIYKGGISNLMEKK